MAAGGRKSMGSYRNGKKRGMRPVSRKPSKRC